MQNKASERVFKEAFGEMPSHLLRTHPVRAEFGVRLKGTKVLVTRLEKYLTIPEPGESEGQ